MVVFSDGKHVLYTRAHQTRQSGRLLRLGFNEVAQFLSKSEVLVALSVFSGPYFLLWIQLNEQNTDHETEEGEVNDTDSEVDETEFSELLNTKANLAGLPLDLSPA
jgi:hypothetical protein